MNIVVGPVLGFRGVNAGRWQVGALVGVEGNAPPRLRWEAGEVAPRRLAEHKGRSIWRFDLEIVQGEAAQAVSYEVEGERWTFSVPAAGGRPHMAYTSCNGFSSLKLMKSVADKNALWKVLAQRHAEAPFHLLLMGGDQVYADEMWECVGAVKRWSELPAEKAGKAPFGALLAAAVRDFYFNLYLRRWSQPELRAVFAAVPTLMMWDDHDIFDGWGSYPAARHNCPVFQGIFALAREYFRLFQRQEDGTSPLPAALSPAHGFTVAHEAGDVAILALDMRSERTGDQVLSPAHWEEVYRWLDRLQGCRHLLVMSSIPVLYPSFEVLERALCALRGSQELEDDLRDHWCSRSHRDERRRLLQRLLTFAERERTRVTLLSGDVHVAALGVLQSDRPGARATNASVINQLISSGVVHPSPPAIALFTLEHLLACKEEIDRGITAEMAKLPGTERRFLGARNFLTLTPDSPAVEQHGQQDRLWAQWHVEGEKTPYTKVIHPVR